MEPTNADIQEGVDELVGESRENPTNAEIVHAFELHVGADKAFQDKQELVNEQFLAFKEYFPDIIREVFAEELKKFFKVTGLNAKTVIVTTATIVGALVVIGGGAKAMLGWLGFTLMK